MPTAQTVQLGDVAEDITVGYVGPMAQEYVEDGIPFLRSLNVRPFRFDPTDLKFISPGFHQKIKKSSLKPGDVVAVRTGNPGVSCVIPENLPDSNCSDLVVIKCGEKLDPSFVSYYINSVTHSHIKGQLVGAIQQHFNIGSAKEMRFPKLDKQEQHKRASVLSALDAKIELNQRMNEELEGMAKLLYDYWFVQYDFPMSAAQAKALGKPHLTGHPYRASGGPMTYHETLKREIPQGWEIRKLSTFCDHIRDTVDPSDVAPCTPYVGLEHVPRRRFTLDAWGAASSVTSLKSQFKSGDVLFGKLRPYFHKVVRAGMDGICTSELLVLRSIDPKFEGFLGSVLFSDVFVETTSNQWGGSKMPRAEWSRMKEYLVPCPPDDLLTNFNDRVLPMWELGATNQRQTQELTQLRDWLLPMLMNGQVTVGG